MFIGRNFLAAKPINAVFQTRVRTENDRLLAAYGYVSYGTGQLSEKRFLDRLTTDLGNYPTKKSKVGPDDEIPAGYLETIIETWSGSPEKDLPEIQAIYDQLKLFNGKTAADIKKSDAAKETPGSLPFRAMGLEVYDYSLTITTPRKFADALFAAMQKADGNNPQHDQWISPDGFIEFCKNWQKYLAVQ